MANMELAFKELADVVEHLVHTNRTWNQDMTHAEAVSKVAAARLHTVATDVAETAQAVESGDVVSSVEEGVKTVTDVVDMEKSNG